MLNIVRRVTDFRLKNKNLTWIFPKQPSTILSKNFSSKQHKGTYFVYSEMTCLREFSVAQNDLRNAQENTRKLQSEISDLKDAKTRAEERLEKLTQKINDGNKTVL